MITAPRQTKTNEEEASGLKLSDIPPEKILRRALGKLIGAQTMLVSAASAVTLARLSGQLFSKNEKGRCGYPKKAGGDKVCWKRGGGLGEHLFSFNQL